MNYIRFLIALAIVLNSCRSAAMQESSKSLAHYQFNRQLQISDTKERSDAQLFIGHLKGFKEIAQKALHEDKKQKKFSSKEKLWLEYCIQANRDMQFKIEKNRNAVYKQLCSLYSESGALRVLSFWQKLRRENRVSGVLLQQQINQMKNLDVFFKTLQDEKIIVCLSLRAAQSNIVYKVALRAAQGDAVYKAAL